MFVGDGQGSDVVVEPVSVVGRRLGGVREPREAGSAARAATGAAGVLAATVQDTHAAIVRHHPVLRLLPRPVRTVQHTATSVIYGLVRLGIAVAGAGAAIVLDNAPRTRDTRPFTGSARGRRLAGMIDGAFGSHLDAAHYPGLSGPMVVRSDGADVALDATMLAGRHPVATGSIVVLVHGLIETEEWWHPAAGDRDFGARLTDDLGATCVRVRYNSGQPVARSGAELDMLLTDLLAGWPVPVTRIDVLGHSMGGLVAHSALHRAAQRADPGGWQHRVRHLICLGTPHHGSPVERGAHGLAAVLAGIDPTAPLGALLDQRSAGIKDLRDGWIGDLPAPPTLRHCTIAATLSRDPASLLGRTVGDLLVPPASALTSTPPTLARAIGGIGHLDLLHHDTVYAVVREWLTDDEDTPQRPVHR